MRQQCPIRQAIGKMREYVEWRGNVGGTQVRIHRRVLAGLEREAGDYGGFLFGTVAPTELVVEDFAVGPSGPDGAEPVGYFRVTSNEEEIAQTAWDAGRLHMVLVFRRDAEGLSLAHSVVKPRERAAGIASAPSHRVLFRAEAAEIAEAQTPERPMRRLVWPVAAILAGLVLGAGAYTWISGGGERPRAEQQQRAADPAPAAVDQARTPEPPPTPAVAPTQSEADRAVDPAKALSKADRAKMQREIRESLDLWTASMLAGDAGGHASLYAASVGPYFTKSRATRAEVADEVRRMLKRYGRMTTYKISDVTIAAVDADHAIANFRKAWSTAGRKFAGEERDQLKFAREGAAWRITSHQELNVYWMIEK